MGINEDVEKRTRAMPLSQRALLRLYFGVSRLIPARLVVALVRRRAAKNAGEDSVERAPERVAWVLPERPEGRVVWLQSIGPGDSTANLVLLEALRALDPTLSFVVTTRTLDGLGVFRKAAEGGGVSLLLAPLDTRAAMTRFIDHWRPDVAVFCEGDLWPNALDLLRRRGIPMALINGQFNGRLGRLVRKLPAFGRWMMAHFDLLHIFSAGGDEEARDWVREACAVVFRPNMKLDAQPLSIKPDLHGQMKAAWGEAPVLTGASVDNNEIAPLLEAFESARTAIPDLRLILAPRWKEQGDAIAGIVEAAGYQAARRSAGQVPGRDERVFIADSYGELGTWFDLSFGVFMGHTLFGGMGHNPYEAIIQERRIIAGSIPSLLATDYSYLRDIGLCAVAEDAASIAAAITAFEGDRAGGAAAFANFAQARGFSREIARRLLDLADESAV